MWSNAAVLSEALITKGFDLCDSMTPIVSIKAGKSLETLLMTREFYKHKILTTPFIYPSVAMNEGRIRLIAGANLSDESLERVKDVVKNMKIKGL